MPRFLSRLLLALAALAFVGGACSSSGDDDDATEEDDTEQVDETTDDEGNDDETDDDADDETDDDSTDDEGAAGDDDALDVLEQVGFSGEAGECILGSLEDQGIDLSDFDNSDVLNPSGELQQAFAQAGADCVDVIAGSDLPSGSTDLTDPTVYDAFVEGFASTSGLPIETAECVADYFVDNDIDPVEVLGSADSTNIVTEALGACQ